MEDLKGKHLFGMVKVGEKGQIVIPKDARTIFGIKPGDSYFLIGDEASGLAIITSEKIKQSFIGILNGQGKPEDNK